MPNDKDRDLAMYLNLSGPTWIWSRLQWSIGHGLGHRQGHGQCPLDMGAWRRKGSAERMAVAQRALPPPAGHTLHCPSVLSQRKVPFHADSGDFPGVRAATPLDPDASIWDSSPN